jgi:hypothetical protein
MPKAREEEIEEYAALHHTAQALGYYMGRRYHVQRGNTIYTAIATVGIAFHLWSALKHFRRVIK